MADLALLARQVDQSQDENIGSASAPSSVSSVITTLVPVFLFALVWFSLFLLFRVKFPRNYHPRTFLGSLRPHERSPAMPNGFFNWIGEFYNIPDTYVLNHHSLDGYLFLRLLKISVVSLVVGCCITWPVLFPVNATGGNKAEGFNVLSMSNIASPTGITAEGDPASYRNPNNYYKYFAHAGCAVIYFSFIIYMITRETIFYINLRQAYLMSPYNASRISSRTVLFTSVPPDYMDEGKLRRMLGSHAMRVWMATDAKELDELVKERDKAAIKLEGGETALIKLANANRLKAQKNGDRPSSEEAAMGDIEHGQDAASLVPAKKRPTHRLKPIIGKKVDTIDWCRGELKRLIPQVQAMQADFKAGKCKKLNSVFVEFSTLSEAQAAYQSLTHHQVLQMAPRYIGMVPDEVIWSNLRIKWWERVIRQVLTISFVVTLIIYWSVPVAAVGMISNINQLMQTPGFTWLQFLQSLPSWLMGVVTGLLPVILLAVLMALLPIILRFTAKLGGDPTTSAVELTVQNSYFAFQVVQVFLVATLGSAASSSVQSIYQNPGSVTTLLAQKIPNANSFYLSYFVLQGLGVVSGVLVGLVGLVLFIVLGKLLDKTPRKQYLRWITLSGIGWGTLFPIYTNLFVIATCYAVVAPLVMGFAAIGLYLFYFAYRYNMLFISNANVDTKGRVYPRAMQQLFVGLYVAELCLIGLFAIATGESVGALGPLIIMIIMLVMTALYHINFRSALGPLIDALPKSIDAEERRLLAEENGEDLDEIEAGAHQEKSNSPSRVTTDARAVRPIEGEANGTALSPAPHKKPTMFKKWLRPDIYTDYATMRRLVPRIPPIQYNAEDADDAYNHPAIRSVVPLLWVPRDPIGVSKAEIFETSKVLPITDEGAYLDGNNKVVWDAEDGRPPIYEEPVYY